MSEPERVGSYLVFPAFAKGGMATVHLGCLTAGGGFSRVVVLKRLHPLLANEPSAAARLLREARLSSRVRSPHVVPTLDVVQTDHELCLVMDLVHGVTLGRLLSVAAAENVTVPPPVVAAIVADVLRGLHAAHEATAEDGTPLEMIHRDVTPQNVIVESSGMTRVLDFGIAKALGQNGFTATGEFRGTLGYAAPEQLRGQKTLTRAADVFACGVVLWEAFTGRRFRQSDDPNALLATDAPGAPGVSPLADAVVLRALAADPGARFPTAEAMRVALEDALPLARREDVAAFVERVAGDDLDRLREHARACEMHAVATSDPPTLAAAAASRRRAVAIASVVFIGAAGVSFAVAATRARPPPPSSAVPSPPPARPSASAETSPAPSAAALPPLARPSASAETSPSPSPSPDPARAKRDRTPAPPHAPPASSSTCSPPYRIGTDGHRHYKPECI